MSVSRKQLKAERRQRRQMVEASRASVEHQQQRQKYLVLGLSGLALLLLVGAFAFFASRSSTNIAATDSGQVPPDTTSKGFPDLGNVHIQASQAGTIEYNSNPPTSGPHFPSLASAGWHDEPVQQEYVVHNLEDGYVAIHYRPDLPAQQKQQLQALVQEYGDKIIAVPSPSLTSPIALAAWTRLDTLSGFDEQRIRNFVQAYRGTDHHKR
ncbi:MAG: DUF3105 domain-containing protein [Chloroflexota bacterium]|nr:DUF3105 domain-containing protein [Chloroflexota bacterium]